MSTTNLFIINGKFMRSGKVVAPVFGDKEQIEVLREYTTKYEALREGIAVELEPDWDDDDRDITRISFNCTCRNYVECVVRLDKPDYYVRQLFLKKNPQCSFCGQLYKFEEVEYGELIVKLKQ